MCPPACGQHPLLKNDAPAISLRTVDVSPSRGSGGKNCWLRGGLGEESVLNDVRTPWGGRRTLRGSEQLICSALLHVKWDTFALAHIIPVPPLNLLSCPSPQAKLNKESEPGVFLFEGSSLDWMSSSFHSRLVIDIAFSYFPDCFSPFCHRLLDVSRFLLLFSPFFLVYLLCDLWSIAVCLMEIDTETLSFVPINTSRQLASTKCGCWCTVVGVREVLS